MDILLSWENFSALLTLTALEIVLGIDNIVFLAIVTGKLPEETRQRARIIGLLMAMLMRIVLLFLITWVMGLSEPFTAILGHPISGRDLILLLGGLFLVGKATHEIHQQIEVKGEDEAELKRHAAASFAKAIVQIMLLDLVFSLDSVITAVGMASEIIIMVIAVVISVGVMLIFSRSIVRFIEKHPTIRMLALSFLILIGVMLVAEGSGTHIDKAYIYFAMAFSLAVEALNIRARKSEQRQRANT